MQNCSTYPNNPYCFCINKAGESTPQYKQFDANNNNIGVGFNCCNKLNYQPSTVANIYPYIQGQYTDVYTYIKAITSTDNRCDYSQYYGGLTGQQASVFLKKNYPDLYNYAYISMEIFNSFYNKDAYINTRYYSSITNNKSLIPVISGNNISCSVENFIPRIIQYQDGLEEKDEFLYICYPKDLGYPSLNTTYSILGIYDNQEQTSKNNIVNTTFSASSPNSIGNEIHSSQEKKVSMFSLLLIIGVLIFLLLLFIVLFSYEIKKNKDRVDVMKR
jgi:hypothetical protein